jgi:hypothetical protein
MNRKSRAAFSEWVSFFMVYELSLFFWFKDFFLRGYTFMSEAQHNLWADWVVSRKLLWETGGSEWNPYAHFGIDFVGREALFNPHNIGISLNDLFPNPDSGFVILTLLFLTLMGLSMYCLLRDLEAGHLCALLGALIYGLAPKWVDEGHHGPLFVVGYAMSPFLLLLIVRMYKNRFSKFSHYVVMAVILAVMYLGYGGPNLVIAFYLFGPFFLYLFALHILERRAPMGETLLRSAASLGFCALLFAGLVAYIACPFLQNYLYNQRSLFGPATGYRWIEYLGLCFPWINRIFCPGIYDLHYPLNVFPYIGFYCGILAVPIALYALCYRLWNKITVFFLVYPAFIMLFWSKALTKLIPLRALLEQWTKGQSSESYIPSALILCLAVTTAYGLQAMANKFSTQPADPPSRKKRCLSGFNRFLSGSYIAGACLFLTGGTVVRFHGLDRYWHLLFKGFHILIYYYFEYACVLFISMFLCRVLLIKLYERKLIFKPWGMRLGLALVVVDLVLCHRIWYPFTNMKERYSNERPQNRFVLEKTTPLDRIGGFQYALGIPYSKVSRFCYQKADGNNAALLRDFGKICYQGFFKPLGEPSFNYFPYIAGRSFYSGHESLMPDYFWDFDQAMNRANPQYQRQSWIGIWDPHSPLLDVAGIKYLFWYEPVHDRRLAEVGSYNLESRIYLNEKAVPRAYLVKRVEYFKDRERLLKRLKESTYSPLSTVTTEDPELYEAAKDPSVAPPKYDLKINKYSPDHVRLTVTSDSKSVLVFNDMYFPHWTAAVNQAPRKIYRVNCLFRGLLLSPGKNEVALDYENKSFHQGAFISKLSWLFVLFYFTILGLHRLKGRNDNVENEGGAANE